MYLDLSVLAKVLSHIFDWIPTQWRQTTGEQLCLKLFWNIYITFLLEQIYGKLKTDNTLYYWFILKQREIKFNGVAFIYKISWLFLKVSPYST